MVSETLGQKKTQDNWTEIHCLINTKPIKDTPSIFKFGQANEF